MNHLFKHTTLSGAISFALLSLTAMPAITFAADPVDLGSVDAAVQEGAYRPDETTKGTASAAAPTQASLKATEPESIITRDFIEQSVAPTAEYSAIVNIAPSVSGTASNGPGLSETKTTLRGFSDDQYNITFDGIPWGDTNNPSHHSTSFFPASVIGGATVERGPGNASNIGYSTFGGSINLFSKKPSEDMGGSLSTSIGTWNTRLLAAGFESGRLTNLADSTIQANYNHLESDGYLSLNSIKSDNVTLKTQTALGDSTVLTFFTSVNHITYVEPDNSSGPTLAQVALYGKNYSLNNDPTSFNYAGYNHTTKDTDFEYLRLQSDLGSGWSIDNNLYTYAYNNQTISSTDPTGGTKPGTKIGAKGNLDIPGIDKQNKYRVYGDILKLINQTDLGTARVGVWAEHSDSDRHQYDLDLTLNVRDPRETKPTPLQQPSVLFHQLSNIDNLQPFAEFEWAATQDIHVTPGVKHVTITRSVDADINQKTRLPENTSLDFSATLPYLTINDQLSKEFAVYGQYAKGYQIPDLKSFYIADPSKNSTDPQQSTNYQIGVVNKTDKMVWDADIYQIDFSNKYVSNGQSGTAAAFINLGGVTYKGVEGQFTYALGSGFSVYLNGSINKATSTTTEKQISSAPTNTAGIGALYKSNGWAASVIYKRTGGAYQTEYDVTNPAAYDYYHLDAYNNVDMSLSYTFDHLSESAKSLKIQLNVFNLLNQENVTSISTGKTVVYDQYTYQAPRSLQLSAKLSF